MMNSIVFVLLCFSPILVHSWQLDPNSTCYITAICATPSPRKVFQNILDAARAAEDATAARVYCGKEGDLYAAKYFDCVTAYGVTEEQWIATVGHACAYHAYPYAKTVAALSPYPRPYAVNQPQPQQQASYPVNQPQPAIPQTVPAVQVAAQPQPQYQPQPAIPQTVPAVQVAPQPQPQYQPQSQSQPQECGAPYICYRSDIVQILQKSTELATAAGGNIATSHPVCRTEAVGTLDPKLGAMRYCGSETEASSLGKVYDACMSRRGVNLQVINSLFLSACFGSR